MPTATEEITDAATCQVCHAAGEGCDSIQCHGLDAD